MDPRVLAFQFSVGSFVLERNLAGVTDDESLQSPNPGGNTMNWIVGHVVRTRNQAIGLLGHQQLFDDHLESVNAAPMTLRTYGIAVKQLGQFLEKNGMPTDPTAVTREHLVEWMRYLQRPKDDDGQGLTAQTALQRYRSVSRRGRPGRSRPG